MISSTSIGTPEGGHADLDRITALNKAEPAGINPFPELKEQITAAMPLAQAVEEKEAERRAEQSHKKLLDSFCRTGPQGRLQLEHGPIATHLHEMFCTIIFNKTLFIYDHDRGIYRVNAGDIEEQVRMIIDETGAKCSITHETRDILYYLSSMNRCHEYPFNKSESTFPVQNGIVQINYETGAVSLLPHGPAHLFTYQLAAPYDASASGDHALSMLHGWVEPEDVPLLVQILAQALLQAQLRIPYKKNYIIQGEPHAGKSTFINFITQVLGNDVVTHKSLQSLCNDRFVAADLEGKLLNAFDELQEIPLENVGQFKALVGSCYHGIERKFQQSYSGIITCPHIFSCNRPPKYPEEVKYDTAFWERWEYVRFPFSYLIDDAFVSKISSGLMYSSFLNLVIAAMIQIRKDRHLTVNRNPEEVMDRWSLESDPLCQFIRVKMTENSNASETSNFDRKKLFEIYQRYCQDESIEPRKRIPTMNKFTRDLQKYKLTPSRTSKRIGGRKETIDIYVGPYRWNGLQQEIEPEVNGLESLG